jgi:hypothetical protein
LSDDKLHRCRIHAIAQRGNHTKVGGREQGIELVLFDGLMATSGKSESPDDERETRINVLMVYRDEIQATILAIDGAHELADLSFEFGRVGKSRGCNLNKDDSTYPLGVVMQQFGECAQFLNDTLDDIQLVAPNDDLFPCVELEEGIQFRLNARTRAENETQQTEAEAKDGGQLTGHARRVPHRHRRECA